VSKNKNNKENVMAEYLVTIETVKIKDFIFSSNKLKVIRGASYLLDYLNQVEVPKILENKGVTEEEILYIGAGNAKFFVENKDKAEEIIEKIRTLYREYAPNAKIVGEHIEIKDNKKIWDLIDELAEKTAQKKSKGFSTLNIDLPFIERCGICKTNPVEVKKEDTKILGKYEKLHIGEDKSLKGMAEILGILYDDDFKKGKSGLCRECLSKLVAASHIKIDEKEIGIYHRIKELENFGFGETIEDYSAKKSFIGFVYADGDGLGDFLSKANQRYVDSKDENGYVDFMKDFSKTLDKNTKDAFIETLQDMKDKFPKDKKGNILYGEFLIIGGDDVCGVFSGDTAIDVSTLFQKKFEKKMLAFEEKYRNPTEIKRNNITASSGVVIAKDKTPLHYLFEQSILLQKSAKARKFEEKVEGERNNGYIDFQVIGSEGTTDIKDFRKGIESLIKRPYVVSTDAERIGGIDEFLNLIAQMKEVRFPKNKIRKFYELKREDENRENFFEFINLASRLDDKGRKVLFEKWIDKRDIDGIKFKEILTNIFDVLEIYDFAGGRDNEGKL
jgi:hypothetical protein